MKRLWNALGKQTKGASFQQKAIQHVEKIEKGEAYVKAPQHEGEKKHFERAQLDETVKKALASRDERLIDSMNKMTIKSSDPPERWTSTKELPTRESELLHKNDPMWEFGFYEPPLDKMPKGKLMFREALEILRARQELDDEGATAKSAQRREQAQEALSAHPATSRINAEQIDLIYKYFRPFERKDTQKVVPKVDLARLQDHLQGRGDEFRLTDGVRDNVRTLLRKNKDAVEDYDKLDAAEKEQLRDAIKQLQAEQQDRLHKRLGEINKMEEAFQQAAKKAMQKQDVDPSDKKQ